MNIDFLTEQEIEQKAEEVLDKAYELEIYNKDQATPLELITDHILCYNIVYESLESHQRGVIGAIECESKIIWLDQSLDYQKDELSAEGRHNFTLAHEIGHFVLHRNLGKDSEMRLFYNENELSKKRIEIQANLFASMLLMPRKLMLKKWNYCFSDILRQEHKIYEMMKFFRVSKQAMSIKLSSLNMI